MDLTDLIKMGASLIQNNDDDKTTGLNTDTIADALGSILGGNDGKSLDLGAIVGNLTNGNLGEIVSSWIGNGENAPIEPDQVKDLVGEDKINEFAEKLGLDIDSAKKALADALPNVVDKATSEDSNILGDLLDKVGGIDGALEMAGKFFNNKG